MNQRRILVVHPDAREGGVLAARLNEGNSSWRVETVADRGGFERILPGRPLDALVIDGSLPGVPAEALFKTASTQCPAAFRLALSGHYDQGTTLRTMGFAHQNLWQPCAPAAVQAALARAFALRDALRNDRLQLLIAQIDTLPSLPRLYLDFLDEIRRKDPSTARLSDIIRQDLSLCSKMLQLVNSAFFGLPHKIDNPEQALLYLGLEHVRALVLSIQVFSLFDRVEAKPFSLEALWEHSWRVGGLARRIASFEERPAEEVETAFTAGLLHDLGKLVLAGGVPRTWREAIETAAARSLPLWQAERDRLGTTHAEVGAALLALWGLSDPIVEAVAFHHEPAVCGSNSFCALTAVHAANLLVKGEAGGDSSYLESLGLAGRFERWRELAGESAR